MRKPIIELQSAFGVPQTRLTNSNVVSFSIKFGGGPGRIFIPKNSPEDQAANMTKFLRIKIYLYDRAFGDYTAAYLGFIDSVKENANGYDVGLKPIHEFFKRRFTNQAQVLAGDIGLSALSLLTQTNSDSPTGITAGTENVSTTGSITADEATIFDTWNNLGILAVNGEWDINPDGEFTFLQRLGTDRHLSLYLRYNVGQTAGNNIDIQTEESEGSFVATRIIASSTDSLGATIRVVKDDAVRQGQIGVIASPIRLDAAKDLTNLGVMAQTVLDLRKSDVESFVVTALPKQSVLDRLGVSRDIGLDFFDMNLGDDVGLIYKTKTRDYSGTKRILAIDYQGEQNGAEKITITLSKTGARQAAFDTVSNQGTFEDILTRLRNVESLV